MPTVLDWNPTVDAAELVREVREVVSAGSLAVLPGDAGYVVLASPVAAGARSEILPGPPAILAAGPDSPAAFGLTAPLPVRRLMFRAWPAPLTVALAARNARRPDDWSQQQWDRLQPAGELRFRCPDHPLFDALFASLPEAAVVVDTFCATLPAALEQLGDSVALAVEAGERTFDRPTLIRADDEHWEIAESGSFGIEEILKLASRMILFVCTGNTCRSPLAEGLTKKMLAARLGCTVEELPGRGFWVLSAGVGALGGSAAMPEAVAAAAELGIDLGSHRSRPVNPPLLAAADDIIAMTHSHAHVLVTRYPDAAPVVRMLCGDDEDLNDPIGSSLDVYRDCARTIQNHLERFIPEWVGS